MKQMIFSDVGYAGPAQPDLQGANPERDDAGRAIEGRACLTSRRSRNRYRRRRTGRCHGRPCQWAVSQDSSGLTILGRGHGFAKPSDSIHRVLRYSKRVCKQPFLHKDKLRVVLINYPGLEQGSLPVRFG